MGGLVTCDASHAAPPAIRSLVSEGEINPCNDAKSFKEFWELSITLARTIKRLREGMQKTLSKNRLKAIHFDF